MLNERNKAIYRFRVIKEFVEDVQKEERWLPTNALHTSYCLETRNGSWFNCQKCPFKNSCWMLLRKKKDYKDFDEYNFDLDEEWWNEWLKTFKNEMKESYNYEE